MFRKTSAAGVCNRHRKRRLLKGPSTELYRQIRDALPDMKLIASGGVSSLEDIDELDDIGCHGVIVGKAIYEGMLGLDELVSRRR